MLVFFQTQEHCVNCELEPAENVDQLDLSGEFCFLFPLLNMF